MDLMLSGVCDVTSKPALALTRPFMGPQWDHAIKSLTDFFCLQKGTFEEEAIINVVFI